MRRPHGKALTAGGLYLTAGKKAETLVLQPQGAEFYQQPHELRNRRSPADTLTAALGDPEQRTQLSHAQYPDPQQLQDGCCFNA